MNRLADDPRIDPRLKAMMANLPTTSQNDVESRDQLLEEVNRPEAVAEREQMTAFLELLDNEDVAPSKGLHVTTLEFTSTPDGNTVKMQFVRLQSDEVLPCVYYIHGGGMASSRASTACTGRGPASSPTRAWPWPWSTSGTR